MLMTEFSVTLVLDIIVSTDFERSERKNNDNELNTETKGKKRPEFANRSHEITRTTTYFN